MLGVGALVVVVAVVVVGFGDLVVAVVCDDFVVAVVGDVGDVVGLVPMVVYCVESSFVNPLAEGVPSARNGT